MYKKLINLSEKLDFIFRNKTLRSIVRRTIYKYPNVIKWENFKEKIDIELKKIPKSSKRVLIAPVVNSDQILICLHSILGMALKLKGVEVDCLVCNMALPACTNAIRANIDEKKFNREGPKKFCNACFDCNHTLLSPVDKNYLKLGNYINPDDLTAVEQISESLNFEEPCCGDCNNNEEYESEYESQLNEWGEIEEESEHGGRSVTLNKPMAGDVKKSKVYVKNEKGNVVKVEFGDPNMTIKKHIPARRKSFRARHNCDNPGPKWMARYWSCKAW